MNMPDEFSEFVSILSDNAKSSLYYADTISRSYGSSRIGTEHLLLGILTRGPSVGAKILADSGITLDKAEAELGLQTSPNPITGGVSILSEAVKISMQMALRISRDRNDERLGTEHLLYAVLSQPGSRAVNLLSDLGADVNLILNDIENYFSRSGRPISSEIKNQKNQAGRADILLKYGEDLVKKAAVGQLDAVIGRDKEVERMILILSRRRKNNPMLIGEPGVGKTAIVEGLAIRIANGDVPEYLQKSRIIQLDIASLVAGTKYRGEFEDRMRKVIEAIRKSKNTIVFMDEIHLLIGAGSAEGAMDAANLLKPALARGEIKMIGATTLDEYKKYIEKDAALERRFQSITVNEPTVAEVKSILRGLKSQYEQFHHVTISDEVIDKVVFLADRYIKNKYMPDKAIDVLDEAAAQVRAKSTKVSSEFRKLKREINDLKKEIDEAVSREEYERAAVLKTRMLQIEKKYENSKKSSLKNKKVFAVTDENVARAVSQITGIAVEKLSSDEKKQLLNLEKTISGQLIGQTDAVEAVAKSIRRGRSGVSSSDRPIGSFIFMGPTGVGKTELARVIAKEVFGSKDALIKIDMSEFSERHTASRLIGAPAGYVGYDDGGQLTDKIRRQPYSVILFDEIEKADKSIFNLLLQLLEDGKLTDGKGRTVDFSNTIIILTSNLGSEAMQKETELGFSVDFKSVKDKLQNIHEKNAREAKKALSEFMRPELINRFDKIINFKALNRDEVLKIADNIIDELKQRLVQNGLSLKVTTAAKKVLVDKGYDEKNGARPLRRLIEDEIENKIAEGILREEFVGGDTIVVSSRAGQIEVSAEQE